MAIDFRPSKDLGVGPGASALCTTSDPAASAPTASTPAIDRDAVLRELADRARSLRIAAVLEAPGGLFSTDLTMLQMRALHLIDAVADLTSGQLAERLAMSAPAVSGLVDRLVRRGEVRRREHPDDRRLRVLSLTDRGREVLDDLDAYRTHHHAHLLDRLCDGDLAELNRLYGVMAQARG